MSCRLNLGSGDFPAEGWVNVDIAENEHVHPDLVASALKLPLPDGCAEAVYAGHVMEHLAAADVVLALAEIRRVLMPDRSLMVVGPDLERAVSVEEREGIIHGARRWPGDEHRWVSTCGRMREMLERCGWRAHEWPIGAVSACWPLVSAAGWQFALEARPQ